MPNKNFARFVVVAACLGLLLVSAPGLSSAAKAKRAVSLSQLINQPAQVISLIASVVDAGAAKAPALSKGRVRPTGDTPIPTPGKGD
jgi:hypothetical protein